MATSEGIPSYIDIELLELNDNPYNSLYEWQEIEALELGNKKKLQTRSLFVVVVVVLYDVRSII